MSLAELREDYRRRLFDEYLPFWENGAFDKQYGGVICELNDDGTVADDIKNTWYQGRGMWTYSFLYNNLDKNQKWIDRAATIHKFAVDKVYAGDGKWLVKTKRDGTVIDGVQSSIYESLFLAEGLSQYYRATGDKKDLELAKESVRSAARSYESPKYENTASNHTKIQPPMTGLRSLGHSMIFIRVLQQWPEDGMDNELKALHEEHLDALVNRFWDPRYGINNEFLKHDYSRFEEQDGCMYSGHSIESLWMVMLEAVQRKDRKLFDTAKERLRRFIEMSWDYVYGGCASADYLVNARPPLGRGPLFEEKTMWAQLEVMVGCMKAFEYTGEVWAKDWYEREREFTLRTMPTAAKGMWRQAVDRVGNNLVRTNVGISANRRDNFHPPRYFMLNLMALDRMIANKGRKTPFPA